MRRPKKEIQLTSYDELLGLEESPEKSMNQVVEIDSKRVAQLRLLIHIVVAHANTLVGPSVNTVVIGVRMKRHFIHRIGIEARPGYIFPTSSFFRGENLNWKPIENSHCRHKPRLMKYPHGIYTRNYTLAQKRSNDWRGANGCFS